MICKHWKAAREYHKTKDMFHVMHILGHKKMLNTLKYTQLVDFKGYDYTSKATKDNEEAQQLIENDFVFVFTMQTQKLYLEEK